MKQKIILLMAALILAGCAEQPPKQTISLVTSTPEKLPSPPVAPTGTYGNFIHDSANIYGIDENLVKAIIKVESGFNPSAVSRSNAIGLMQLKAETAGRDAYRYKGRYGQPSSFELKDPEVNIDLGTAYLGIIKRQLAGISDQQTLRYAIIVSYVNGTGALLRTFSSDKDEAIARINDMTPEQFYRHVQTRHPAAQAPRYLWKVNTAYLAMR